MHGHEAKGSQPNHDIHDSDVADKLEFWLALAASEDGLADWMLDKQPVAGDPR